MCFKCVNWSSQSLQELSRLLACLAETQCTREELTPRCVGEIIGRAGMFYAAFLEGSVGLEMQKRRLLNALGFNVRIGWLSSCVYLCEK